MGTIVISLVMTTGQIIEQMCEEDIGPLLNNGVQQLDTHRQFTDQSEQDTPVTVLGIFLDR